MALIIHDENEMRGRRKVAIDGTIRWEGKVKSYYDPKDAIPYSHISFSPYPQEPVETDSERTLRQLREEGERQLAALRLTREEVSNFRQLAEQQMGSANTQELGKLRAEVARLQSEIMGHAAARKAQRENAEQMRARFQKATATVTELTTVNERLTQELVNTKRLLPDPTDPRDWTADVVMQQQFGRPALPVEQAACASGLRGPSDTDLQQVEKRSLVTRVLDSPAFPIAMAGTGGAVLIGFILHLLKWI